VPGRILSDFVNNLYTDNITLTTKNNSLFIQTPNTKTKILGFDTKEFPIIPKIKEGIITSVPSKVLRNALVSVYDSIAQSETRPELAGLYVQFKNDQIILAATDSFRLTERIIVAKNNHTQVIIIPKATVSEIIRVTGESEGETQIKINDNQIAFLSDDFELISRLIDGNYPDYTKIIPEKFISKALVERTAFEQTIKLASLFSSSIADVKLSCEEGKLTLSAQNSDRGESEVEVPVILKNEPFEISLNFHYLLDGIKVMDSDKMVIEFNGNGSPLVLRPAEEKKHIVYLIMPLRS